MTCRCGGEEGEHVPHGVYNCGDYRPVSPSRARGGPDGTDRGAAMTEERLALARQHTRRLVRELVAEVDRLRALSTGQPSPDIAALLDAYRDAIVTAYRDEEVVADVAGARAAVDAHLVSLLARVTAAERDAERLRQGMQFIWDALDNDDEIEAFRMADVMRAALPPSLWGHAQYRGCVMRHDAVY